MSETITTPTIIVRTEKGLTIAGTRITLYTIMDHLKQEWPPHLIRDWFNLSEWQIQGVLDYIKMHPQKVEDEYQQVLQKAEETERYWREYNREHFAKVASLPYPPGQEKTRAKLTARKMTWVQN